MLDHENRPQVSETITLSNNCQIYLMSFTEFSEHYLIDGLANIDYWQCIYCKVLYYKTSATKFYIAAAFGDKFQDKTCNEILMLRANE